MAGCCGRTGAGRVFRSLALAACLALACGIAAAADWPAWRCDPGRSGVSPEALPSQLSLRWVTRQPPPRRAWPDPRLAFDAAFHPVVSGKTLVFGSSREDSVIGLDLETGAEKWRFLADGPVRLAPAIAQGRVYAVSDDGTLICLELATGKPVWTFQGAPSAQKVLGNERLISMWPARGGPVVHEGVVYFTAGIWPFMGVFVYAVDATTGRLVWHNDRGSAAYGGGATDGASFGTLSPQGALAVAGDRLVVPSGRAWPAYFDRLGGEMMPHAAGIKDSSGGGDSQLAVRGDFLLMGGCVFSVSQQRALVFNGAAATVTPFAALPILDGNTLYAASGETLIAYDLNGARLGKLSGAYGRPLMRCDTPELWKLPVGKRVDAMIKAGARIHLAGAGWVSAVDLPAKGGKPFVSWQGEFAGRTASLAAADGKLFVSTCEGSLWCFGEGEPLRGVGVVPASQPAPPGRGGTAARALLERCGVKEGYAYLIGVQDGGLVEDLAGQSRLHLVTLERDPARRDRLRKRLLAAGLYGERAAVLDAAPESLPPYLASLIVCGTTQPDSAVLMDKLRPHGGVLCLGTGPDARVVRREGPLPGAADWSHDAGDAGNTWMGQDQRVKAPLGVLWFGGAAGDSSLFMQRHSDPPAARVCQGRMFLHGDDQITAVDAYTGRVLWNRSLPAVRAYQNLRSNVEAGPPREKTGETSKRAAFVAHPEGLYLAYGQSIRQWDPQTGQTRAEFAVPAENGSAALFLADLRLAGDVLVAGADFPTQDREAVFVADDFRQASPEELAAICGHVGSWLGPDKLRRSNGQPDLDRAVGLCNQALQDPGLAGRVPRDEKTKEAAAAAERQQAVQRSTFAPFLKLEHANRRLLEACFPVIRRLPPKIHWSNLYPWDGTSTRQLAGLDRRSGRLLWRQHATHGFPQKSLAVGRDRVFCLDRTDPAVDDVLRRRGLPIESQARLLAFDLRSGRVVWSRQENISGYEMFYSATHDVLVQASQHDPAPEQWWSKPRDLSVRFLACRGADGRLLWDRTVTFTRPGGGHRLWHNWLLQDRTIILESYRDKHAEFYGFDLITGAPRMRKHPVSGAEQPWGFHRMGGCTKNISCPDLVLFRSLSAGYFDAAGDGGTANLGGFRPGCKNSLIPAAGLLNAPNYASGCTCNYPVFTSLALVHMPGAEQWSTNDYAWDGQPVQRLGLNLGAPGDRRASDGTLWLDFPSVGGASPDVPVSVKPADVRWFYRHSSRMRGAAPGWVVGSGAEGVEELSIRLQGAEQAAGASSQTFTVRLYFAEHVERARGKRVFSISLQGKEVLRDLDILAETGALDTGLVREFRGIAATGSLCVRLVPRSGRTLLCGVELVRE